MRDPAPRLGPALAMSAAHDLDDLLRSAVAAARAAGDVLAGGFASSDKQARMKGHPNNPVTVYDRRAEETIVDRLTAEHSEDGILTEESDESEGTSGRRWVIDPLDGTNNFLAGIPHFAVSIALEDADGALVACVHDPIRNETFTAARDRGARLNGRQIEVSKRESLEGAVVGVGLSFEPRRRTEMIGQLPALIAFAGVLRTLGSAALDLAYVAAGRFDAIWYLALHPWDVAAGRLLVAEAGGRITDLRGLPADDPLGGIVASNRRLHGEFVDALA